MDNRRIDRIKVTLNYFLKSNGLVSFDVIGKNNVRFTYRDNPSDKPLTFRAYIIDTLNDETCYTRAFILECENNKVPLVYQDLVDDNEFESAGLDKIIEGCKKINVIKEQIEKELDDVF